MSKDVIIAGALAVGCVALIAAAFLLPKSKPAEEPKPEVVATETQPLDPLAAPLPGEAGSIPSVGLPMTPGMPSAGPAGTSPFPAPGPAGSIPAFGTPAPAFGAAPSGHGFDSNLPAPAPVVEPTPAPVATEAKTHTVANGELLGDIALKYYGSSKAWKKIAAANPGVDAKHLKVGQKLVIPADDSKGAAGTTAAVTAGAGEKTYTIKKGDTYYAIAKRELGSANRWKEIKALNGNADLHVGHTIKLPGSAASSTGSSTDAASVSGKTHVVAKGETLADIARKYLGSSRNWKKIVEANPGVSPENLKIGQKLVIPGDAPAASVTAPVAGAAGAASTTGDYVVQPGDTPRTIAQKLLGSKNKAQQIIDANPGINPTNLRVGQKLKIPGGASAPAPVAQPVAPAPAPAFPAPAVPGAAPVVGAPAPAPGASPFQPAPAVGGDFGSPYGNQGFGQPAPGAPAPGQPSPFAEPAGQPIR